MTPCVRACVRVWCVRACVVRARARQPPPAVMLEEEPGPRAPAKYDSDDDGTYARVYVRTSVRTHECKYARLYVRGTPSNETRLGQLKSPDLKWSI